MWPFPARRKRWHGRAELLGAAVWGVDAGELDYVRGIRLYRDRRAICSASRVFRSLLAAMSISSAVRTLPKFSPIGGIFAPDAKVIHIDLNAYEIAKNHRVDLGVVSDPKLTLSLLASALEPLLKGDRAHAARTRKAAITAAEQEKRKKQLDFDAEVRDEVPLHASRFMEELARRLPIDAVIFDEALTCSPELTRYLPPRLPGHFFQTRGGSLGVGIPGALGLKLANPEKTVVGFTGDGGGMYTIQALWTAAHHGIGANSSCATTEATCFWSRTFSNTGRKEESSSVPSRNPSSSAIRSSTSRRSPARWAFPRRGSSLPRRSSRRSGRCWKRRDRI